MNSNPDFILDSIFYSVPGLKILQGAFIQFSPGEICALFGRNGAGKSTLMKIAAGQYQPDSGLTIIDGHRFFKRSLRHRYSLISYLPQTSMLPNSMSVRQLLKSFPAGNSLHEDPLVKKVMKQKVRELSGGERRYLEVLLLLSLERKYVLLDEPFTGVEPNIVERIINRLVSEAEKGRGLIITDHYHQYVMSVANKGYLMQNKQCYLLDDDMHSSLVERGYIR